ncbi:MAG TPA: glycosyltransferase [Verrucomicrobiae bacterium]|jgi:glycosyltransferase involved in cell wall biosynthesis|nr:glycosyltransferase [Verrucomicrobiae bacterium]
MKPHSPALRIVHLNSLLTGGGTDDQCVKLAAELHRLGQRVVLAGPRGRAFQKTINELGAPFFDTGRSFVLNSARLLRREKAQIAHGHHGRDLWPTVLAARLSGVRPKIILSRHLAKSPGSWASRRFLLGQCDAIIAVSEFVAKVLREGVYEPNSPEEERRARGPMRGDFSKIRVIYGGIDTARFHPQDATEMRRKLGLKPGDFAFGVVGSFDFPRGKGQREFLQAAAQVPRGRFLIIGRGGMEAVLQEDIKRLGLEGRAWLTGHVGEMPLVMNALDCLVHPQIGTEALGLVVCEAQACGTPVIASALDGIPEAFAAGRLGRLVEPENIAQLAQAMREQTRVTPKEAEAAHTRVEQAFSLAVSAENTLRLYRELA